MRAPPGAVTVSAPMSCSVPLAERGNRAVTAYWRSPTTIVVTAAPPRPVWISVAMSDTGTPTRPAASRSIFTTSCGIGGSWNSEADAVPRIVRRMSTTCCAMRRSSTMSSP